MNFADAVNQAGASSPIALYRRIVSPAPGADYGTHTGFVAYRHQAVCLDNQYAPTTAYFEGYCFSIDLTRALPYRGLIGGSGRGGTVWSTDANFGQL